MFTALQCHEMLCFFFFCWMKGPRTTALRLFVQPQWWWRWAVYLLIFTINGAPVEWNRQGKTDNSEKNLSQCHFVYHKSHIDLTWDRTPGLRGERPATNRLSHGTANPQMLPNSGQYAFELISLSNTSQLARSFLTSFFEHRTLSLIFNYESKLSSD
jgi:hypothetical protein